MQITPAQQAAMDHRPLGDIRYFIVHHSVSAKTLDIAEIAMMEKIAQNFVAVGYDAYCKKLPNGSWVLQEGRTIDDVPAAAYGLNEPSYDVCIAGNYEPNVPHVPTDTVEDAPLDLLVARIKLVKAKCPNLKYLIGHLDVAKIMAKRGRNPEDYSTECPGSLLYPRLHGLRLTTGLSLPPELL